jgi:hypothetical protein
MEKLSPVKLIIIGVALMIAGVVLPLLMVIRAIPTSFLISFLSYGCSVSGMFLAFFGLFSYVRIRRDK